MKEIKLTQGKFALVDDEDFDFLNQFKWCAHKTKNTYYASRRGTKLSGVSCIIYMHRFLLNMLESNLIVDHVDGDGLHNDRSNLRICTHRQNMSNRIRRKVFSSDYFGVRKKISGNSSCWQAQITNNGKCRSLGYFKEEADAALAYNIAATKCHGEFARLNIL